MSGTGKFPIKKLIQGFFGNHFVLGPFFDEIINSGLIILLHE